MMNAKGARGIEYWRRAFAILSLWIVLFLLLELVLRSLNPGFLEFASEARKVHCYSPKWKVDVTPSSTAVLRLRAADGHWLYNFLITTSPYGFRSYDRDIDHHARLWSASKDELEEMTIVHAVGDSFTMGWGVNYTDSYPAQLERLLPADHHVLNLGLDGFGTIAATKKSEAVWDTFPADYAVYLASPNDLDDDRLLSTLAERGALYHRLFAFYDFARRYTYTANLLTAAKWQIYFTNLRKQTSIASAKQAFSSRPNIVDSSPITPRTDRIRSSASLSRLDAYAQYVADRGATLLVYVLGENEDAMAIYFHCVDKGIETLLLDLPDEAKLIREGHFNAFGNSLLAELVAKRIMSDINPREDAP